MSRPILLLDRIEELVDAGVAAAEIAWELRCPSEAVKAVLRRRGSPVPAPVVQQPARRPWPAGEDAIVEEMSRAGLTPAEVGGVLRASGVHRSTRSVSLRMRSLAERAQRQAAKRTPLR